MFALSPLTTFLYPGRVHCKPNVTVFCYRLSCIKYICRYMLIYRYLFCAWFVLEYVNPKRVPSDYDSNQYYGLMKKCCIITHLCKNFNRYWETVVFRDWYTNTVRRKPLLLWVLQDGVYSILIIAICNRSRNNPSFKIHYVRVWMGIINKLFADPFFIPEYILLSYSNLILGRRIVRSTTREAIFEIVRIRGSRVNGKCIIAVHPHWLNTVKQLSIAL